MEQKLYSLREDLRELDLDCDPGSDVSGCHRRDLYFFQTCCISTTPTKIALELVHLSEWEFCAVAALVARAPNAEPMMIEFVL
jgi:hypothetical protein